MGKRINESETLRRMVAAAEMAENDPQDVDYSELPDRLIIQLYGTMLSNRKLFDLGRIENEIKRRSARYLREMLETEGLIAYEEEGQQDG